VTNLWTKLTVLLLALDGLGSLYAISSFKLSMPEVFGMVVGIELVFVLAVVAWMETKWGALLVVLLGFVLFLQNLIGSYLYLVPEWGPQWQQYLWGIIYLLISAFSYLSYRKITKPS